MKNSDWYNLIISVGKLHIRKLSPIEVAQTIELAEKEGFSLKEIASRCMLQDTSMLFKFKNLLKIREDYWHLIDWGEEGALLAFTNAQFVARYEKDVQKVILDTKIKFKLNKDELNTLLQRIDRSGMSLEDCISEAILKKKRTIINVFIGAIFRETEELTSLITQYEKEKIIQDYLKENYPDARIIVKTGKKEFTLLIYDEKIFNKISLDSSLIELKINKILQSSKND